MTGRKRLSKLIYGKDSFIDTDTLLQDSALTIESLRRLCDDYRNYNTVGRYCST